MSASGNDCHFFYNATCLKGDSCPFRHCEAAKATDITCTFWRQKTCTKPFCSFRHSEGVSQNKNRAEIPCYWETQPVGCTKTACPFKHQNPRSETPTTSTSDEVLAPGVDAPPSPVVEVQPIVVNLAEDSDAEMTSPVKAITTERKAVPIRAVKQLITAPGSETAIQKHGVALTVNRPSIHRRLTTNPPDLVRKKLMKERLKMGSPDTGQPNSVKARLGVNKPDISIKNRLGVQQQMDNPEKSTADDTGDSREPEVKSLEQIQRDKALRSMGLIELKGGKIMKLADWEKERKGHSSPHQSEEEEEEYGEVDEDTEEEEEVSGEDEKEEEEDEEEEEEENDLEEPEEIELFAPDEPEHEEDTRTFVSTGDTKKIASIPKSQSKIITKSEDETRRVGRRIVIEDGNPVDDSTPDLKASLKRRLGGRVSEVAREPMKPVGERSIKKRLTMPIGSLNQGTVKTVRGIKSRLGTASNESATLDARQKLKPKQTVTLKNMGFTGITLSTSRESNEEESKEVKEKTVPVRKRGWRKITKLTVDGSDTDSSRPVTPDQTLSVNSSPEKSTVTEGAVGQVVKRQKKEDGGAKLQNLLTQRMRNNNVWSNRNTQKSRGAGESLDSLGIGIIDIKGGKVVKIGKNKEEENKETKREDKLLAHIEKLSKHSRRVPKERGVYVPPALKKADVDGPDVVKSQGSLSNTEIEADETGEDTDNPKVMTFSEIMAAKRQRQKRLAEKRNAEVTRKKSIDNLELPQEDFDDSNEAPADVLKIAQMITGSMDSSTSKSEESNHHHHRSKKKSKWRKKRKASKERKDQQQSDKEKDSAQDTLKTVDNTLSEDSQNSNFVSSKNSLESDDLDSKKIKRQISETMEEKMSDKEEISPAKKRVEQLLSDSWLDLDVDNTEGETGSQDEDDLLREIDELLA